jgi:hypothetical protein
LFAFDPTTANPKKYNQSVAHPDILTSQVPEGDYILSKRPTRWLVWRSLGHDASRTTWAFEDGEEPALAQALAFARRDETGVWLRVSEHQFRLIQSFRPKPTQA